jgi:hypothetical protein
LETDGRYGVTPTSSSANARTLDVASKAAVINLMGDMGSRKIDGMG